MRPPQKQDRPGNPAARFKSLRHYFEAKGKDTAPPLEPARKEDKVSDPVLGQNKGKDPVDGTREKEPTS